jgi:hypothetical protein
MSLKSLWDTEQDLPKKKGKLSWVSVAHACNLKSVI